ncbi:MAG: hypothetical protein K6C08_02915 [Oscillospiraceae bacterium]|nr:hypothetical protein [Oscillospiraceae bacterium]
MSFKKAVALILILAVLAGGGYYLLKTEKEDDDRMRSLYSEVEPLERERESLLQELNALPSEYALKSRNYATIEIMFKNLNGLIYDDLYPIMRKYDVVGVLPFSWSEMPGISYDKLTWEECQTLASVGWGTCVVIDGWGSVGTLCQQMSQQLVAKNLPAPTSVYFVNNEYDPSMDAELLGAGITTVILNGKDGRSQTVTEIRPAISESAAEPAEANFMIASQSGLNTDTQAVSGSSTTGVNYDTGTSLPGTDMTSSMQSSMGEAIQPESATGSGLWLTYAMPWNYTGFASDLELLGRTDGANQVYIYEIKSSYDSTKKAEAVEKTELQSFEAILKSWKDNDWIYEEDLLQNLETVGPTPYIYVDTNDPEVLHQMYLDSLTTEQKLLLSKFIPSNFDTAYSYHLSAIINADAMQSELAFKQSSLQSQIAALQQQISDVYSRYGVNTTPNLDSKD